MAPSSLNSQFSKNAESKKESVPKAESKESEGKAGQRVLLVLTALPLGLACFAFLVSNPPFEDESLPGWADRQGKADNSSSQLALHGCVNRPKNNNFMFPYRTWQASLKPLDAPKLCICTSTSAGLDQVLPWIFYHRTLGVELFLIFAEGKAAAPLSVAALETIPGVRVIQRTKELEFRQAHSRIWNETWLAFFFYKPCNYELFVRQSLNMEDAINMAREARVDWIMHVDTDELLYPAGASEFSLQRLLSEAPPDVDTVVFPNYETAIERDDIKDPFVEISMYKKNFDHVAKEAYFAHYKDATKGNPNYYLTYGNGKSAARMVDHLRGNGAHRFHNYARMPKEHKFPEAAVLHYTYTKFSDLTSRRDRCGCKPNKEDVKRCFMLDFDRLAFIVASTQTEEQMRQWYRDHVVWSDREMNDKLLKKGLFGRIYTPQVIVRGIVSSGVINATLRAGREMLRKRSESGTATSGAGGVHQANVTDVHRKEASQGALQGGSGSVGDDGASRGGLSVNLIRRRRRQGASTLLWGRRRSSVAAVGNRGGGLGEHSSQVTEGLARTGASGGEESSVQRRRLLAFAQEEYVNQLELDEGLAVPPLAPPSPQNT